MNDEIKEILEEVNKIIDNTSYNEDFTYFQTSHISNLLDYITNLQQENKEWAMIFDTFSKRPYAHRYLEEKRKELGNDKIIGLDSEMIYKDYYDYKSRAEKAVDYINKNKHLSMFADCREPEEEWNYDLEINPRELLNILQNGSDEE